MQRKWVIPIIATVLALVTTLAIVQYLQGLRPQVTVVQPIRPEAVVVAKTDIGGRTLINANQVEIRQIPFNAIHPRAARRIADVVNRVALSTIYADQQVVDNALAPAGVNAGLSYVLPKDKRALTIPVNEVVDVAGFVVPGDRVDVIGTVSVKDENLSKIFLQDIPVLAIAQTVEQKPGEQPHVTTSATLALTPDQAEILTQVDNNGKVRLALRPSGITTQVATAGKTIEAALALHPAVVLASGPTGPDPAPVRRYGLPRVLPPASSIVEIWRGTQKTTVSF
jgi:pilus assembly protein CpaB